MTTIMNKGQGNRSLMNWYCGALCAICVVTSATSKAQEEPTDLPKAFIDGSGLGWRELGEKDFMHVNCDPDTWTWKDGEVHCTGKPVGVIRSRTPFKNFELVAQWRHL